MGMGLRSSKTVDLLLPATPSALPDRPRDRGGQNGGPERR
jgi:hypothetical protein